MSVTVFVEARFWLLVVFSFVVPVAIYVGLLAKRAISPALFAGVGINVISHVLIRHLDQAEKRFESDQRDAEVAAGSRR